MSDKCCERCGTRKPSPTAGAYELFDYCEKCSKDLCDACMAKGCCGHTPALSGMMEDHGPPDSVPDPHGGFVVNK
jgi:hypothetical protein